MHGGGGRVFAFAIDSGTGDLIEINHVSSYGSMPSYPVVDASGQYLLVTHHTTYVPVNWAVRGEDGRYRIELEYDDATTVLFPLGTDGAIGEPCDIYIHAGTGGPLARQSHPQLHSVMMAPSGSFFLVCDKGSDRLSTFRIDPAASRLQLCATYDTIPGGGPATAGSTRPGPTCT